MEAKKQHPDTYFPISVGEVGLETENEVKGCINEKGVLGLKEKVKQEATAVLNSAGLADRFHHANDKDFVGRFTPYVNYAYKMVMDDDQAAVAPATDVLLFCKLTKSDKASRNNAHLDDGKLELWMASHLRFRSFRNSSMGKGCTDQASVLTRFHERTQKTMDPLGFPFAVHQDFSNHPFGVRAKAE